MATIDDINTAKNAAVTSAQAKLDGAIDAKNAATGQQAVDMTTVVNDFSANRDAILLAQYLGDLNSVDMQKALDAITAATDDMKKVAKVMTTVTTYISNATAFVNAGAKVVTAIKSKA